MKNPANRNNQKEHSMTLSRIVLIILPALLLLNTRIYAETASSAVNRVKLIFSLDQGFGNGVIVQNDQVAIRRIIRTLEPLKSKYDVFLLLNPQIGDKRKLETTLTTLKAMKMSFVLDVYTSDAYTLGSCTGHNAPYDSSHALSISMEYLTRLKIKYGKNLAGLRFMEVFGQDFTVRAIKTTNPEWARPAEKLPPDNVFQRRYAEQFIKFAKDNAMFLQWADFHWYAAAPWDGIQKEYEKTVSELLRKYPGVITVTYNNNEPLEQSAPKINMWHTIVKGYVEEGAAGYGLSDQSWLHTDHMKTPPEEIVAWAESALRNGSELIQFEPAWYFFRLPVGSFEMKSFGHLAEWKDRGMGTINYEVLKNSLLKESN